MSAYLVSTVFERGYIPRDAEILMSEMPDFDSRLPTLIKVAFDDEIYQRAISVPKDALIDN